MDESELIVKLRRGDRGACGVLVADYGPRLLRAALALCRNRTDAEDLVQDTLVAAVRQASTFRGKCALFTWLYGILRRKHLAQFRRNRRLVYTPDLPDRAGDSEPPSAAGDRRTVAHALGEALGRLSDEHRDVVLLRFAEEMKLARIAEHLGISAGTAKSRLHYALKALRRDLGEALNLFR